MQVSLAKMYSIYSISTYGFVFVCLCKSKQPCHISGNGHIGPPGVGGVVLRGCHPQASTFTCDCDTGTSKWPLFLVMPLPALDRHQEAAILLVSQGT